MDVWTFGIEGDWFTIAQDRLQWSAICEQIHLPDSIVEVCAANRSSQTVTQTFFCTCSRTFKCSGDLKRHQPFCGTQHLDHGNLEVPMLHCSCGRTFSRKGDLTMHSHFCKATYSQGVLLKSGNKFLTKKFFH